MHQANWPAVFVEVFGSQRVEFAIGVMICCSATASIVSLPLSGAYLFLLGPCYKEHLATTRKFLLLRKFLNATNVQFSRVCTSFTNFLWCLAH